MWPTGHERFKKKETASRTTKTAGGNSAQHTPENMRGCRPLPDDCWPS
jgi:hypothetical protein